MYKRNSRVNFADIAIKKRKINTVFFDQIERLINWSEIEKLIDKIYSKGKRPDGRPAYPGLLLFKICMIENWFNINDNYIEDKLNDSISLTHFIGLSLDDEVPSKSTISRFKQELKSKDLYQQLVDRFNKQLKEKGLEIKTGQYKEPKVIKSIMI